jgi:hypothetical protein
MGLGRFRPERMGRMHLNRGLLGWGVFFIVLGAVPLAVNGGVLDADLVRRAWELWPLILIGIGLGLVLERTRLAVLGSLVVAITFGLMGGALVASGIQGPIGITSCGGGADRGDPFAEQRGSFAGAADVDLDLDCGELTLDTSGGNGWTFAGRSPNGEPPAITSSDTSLRVRSPQRSGVSLGDEGSRWELGLPSGVALSSLSLSINAGSADARPDGASVTGLSVSVNAGSATVDLGRTSDLSAVSGSVNAGSLSLTLPRPPEALSGSLSVNVGSLDLCVPEGAPLRIRTGDSPLGSNNFESRGLTRNGTTWTTPGFETAAGTIDLRISTNLGSVTLDPEDGCD